jgi:hypothetical protein
MEDDDHLWDDWANKTSTLRARTPSMNHRASTSSAVGSTAGADDLATIYGIGEDEIEEGNSPTDRTGSGQWGASEIEEVDLRDDVTQDAKVWNPSSLWSAQGFCDLVELRLVCFRLRFERVFRRKRVFRPFLCRIIC